MKTVALTLILSMIAGCGFTSISEPEKALLDYVRAINEGRCEDARNFLSRSTNHALEYLKVKPQHPQEPRPIEEYYCNKLIFDDCKLNKTTIIEQGADSTKVSMPCGRTQDGVVPGTVSPFLKYEPRTYELIREDGNWHVVEEYVVRMVEVREKEDRARAEALERQHSRLASKQKAADANVP